jgi:hypothetical protein
MCPESLTEEEWQGIEERVQRFVNMKSVRSRDEFKQLMVRNFFKVKDEDKNWVSIRPSFKQERMLEYLWDDLKHLAGRKEEKVIEVSLKEYPKESRRSLRALRIYKGILKIFNKGYSRGDVVRHYVKTTHRKKSTVERDITAMSKIGIIKRRHKRGYYTAESNVYV